MNFLLKAKEMIKSKGVYFTPKKVKKIIDLNCIIKNPPYLIEKS
jgi:hypothetical protein